MDALSTLQQKIDAARSVFATADKDYYVSLQKWSVGQQAAATLTAGEQKRDDARAALQAALSALNDTTPQEWIKQVTADLPFLLFPVRVEARYVTVRHVVYPVTAADSIDISTDPQLGTSMSSTGFAKDESGVMTYGLPVLPVAAGISSSLGNQIKTGAVKPNSGHFIARKADDPELRIRMYPDDVYYENHEEVLTAEEQSAGQSFWTNVCGGADAKAQWMRLSAALKPARSAWIIRATLPSNFVSGQPLPAHPVFATPTVLKDGPYTQPPVARLLPDRFVVRLYKGDAFKDFSGALILEPLVLGLDPTVDPLDQDASSGMQGVGAAIATPDYLQWIHDFEAAEKVGLALRVNLKDNPEYQTGVDKIVVTGAKLSVNAVNGQAMLAAILENHLYKEDGLSLLPKGVATNNFDGEKSAYNNVAADSLAYFNSQWQSASVPAGSQTDESRFRYALGLTGRFAMPLGQTTDISDALQMNDLMWPGTMGYSLLQFFSPALSLLQRENIRQFFRTYVSARGLAPVVRINRQPYGLIPVTALDYWQPSTNAAPEDQLSAGLWTNYLSKFYALWKQCIPQIKTVAVGGQGLDENFFNIVSTSPVSASLKRQWMAGTGLQGLMQAVSGTPTSPTALMNDPNFKPAVFATALQSLGIPGNFLPLLNAYFTSIHDLRRVIVDGLPLDDARPLELIAGKSWNYLEWLAKAKVMDLWNNDFTPVPAGTGAVDSSATVSVMAVMTRQAVLRAFLESGLQVVETNPAWLVLKMLDLELLHLQPAAVSIDPTQLAAGNQLHQLIKPVLDAYPASGSFELQPDRRVYLSQSYPATGTATLADWLDANKSKTTVPVLEDAIAALTNLSGLPTARLQRLFMEHLDLCSHRLDAWLGGMIYQRLDKQRAAKPSGLYLGAYGYLLSLAPAGDSNIVFQAEKPTYLELTADNFDLAAIPLVHRTAAGTQGMDLSGATWNNCFFYVGSSVNAGATLDTANKLIEPANGVNPNASDGYILTPSSAHAVTAAILRSGFLHHSVDDQTALLAVQLNSPRVRQAMELLEGMQQGNSLGELLGYYFERLLHDNQLDRFLYDIRRFFPLPRTTGTSNPSPFTGTDGQLLLSKWKASSATWLSGFPFTGTNDYSQLSNLAAQLADYLDALSDLLLAESVYQSAKGNRERAAAALRILNGGGQVVLPEFVRTPTKGTVVTHRMAALFQYGQTAAAVKGWTTAGSPRAHLMPEVNHWLVSQLPAPAKIILTITAAGQAKKISLQDLAIEPVDLLQSLPPAMAQLGQSPLGALLQQAVIKKFSLDWPAAVTDFVLDGKDRLLLADTEISLFEVMPLLTALKKLAFDSRPLTPNDFLLPDQPAASPTFVSTDKIKASLTTLCAASGPVATTAKTLLTQSENLTTAVKKNMAWLTVKPIAIAVQNNLCDAWRMGIETGAATGLLTQAQAALLDLANRATSVSTLLTARIAQVRTAISAIPSATVGLPRYQLLQAAAAALFAGKVNLIPEIKLVNPTEATAALTGQNKLQFGDVTDLDEWTREAAQVRKSLQPLRQRTLFGEALIPDRESPPPVVLQFPFLAGQDQPWLGSATTTADPSSLSGVSVIIESSTTPKFNQVFTGLVFDEWPEFIPDGLVDTGIAFQSNQADTQPPQALLLAVSPVESGSWDWEYLTGAVNESLTLAQTRLVSPDQIRASNFGLAQVLPALHLPFLAANNELPVIDPL